MIKMRKLCVLLVVSMLTMICVTGCSWSKKDKAEEKQVFQIQRLEGISLEDASQQLPCKVQTYSKSTDAFNNPTTVYYEQGIEFATINFSFTSEEGEILKSVKDGMVIETNETMSGVKEVNAVGDIATFKLEIEPQGELTTIIYEFAMDEESDNRFLALRILPQGAEVQTETQEDKE